MEKIELSKGFVTLVKGVEEIDNYTKSNSRYHIEKDFNNKDCVLLCEFKSNNTGDRIQPIFFYDKGDDKFCVQPLYGHNHYHAYDGNVAFIELVNELFLLYPELQKYVGRRDKGVFNDLNSHNGEYYTEEGELIRFKKPIFRVDHPYVCICMNSTDENNEELELQITETNDKFIIGTTYHGFGNHIKLYTSFDAAIEDKISSLKQRKEELLEEISDINEEIEKTISLKA